MRTTSILLENHNQVICIPKDLEFHGVIELEINRGEDALILRPVRPSWTSPGNERSSDSNISSDREDIIENERFG